MDDTEHPNPVVGWTRRLEENGAIDPGVDAIEPTMRRVFGSGARGSVLRGEWLGHAVHPLLTDLVLGSWTSATLLDLFGGSGSRPAAQRLVGVGLLAVAPTAWTGWAEWVASGRREQRVGLVHATSNAMAIGIYAASWLARRSGRHRVGVGLALAGAGFSGLGGYLGSHLALGRKVGSRDPAYETPSA